SGWWLIPDRVAYRARSLVYAATQCELRKCETLRHAEYVHSSSIVRRLHIWRRSRHWQRKVTGRRPPDSLLDGYGAWYRLVVARKPKRRIRDKVPRGRPHRVVGRLKSESN